MLRFISFFLIKILNLLVNNVILIFIKRKYHFQCFNIIIYIFQIAQNKTIGLNLRESRETSD